MDWTQFQLVPSARLTFIVIATATASVWSLGIPAASAQVRGKRPDRGTYQSPTLIPVEVQRLSEPPPQQADSSADQSLSPAIDESTSPLQPVAYDEVHLVQPQINAPTGSLPSPGEVIYQDPIVMESYPSHPGDAFASEVFSGDSYCDGCDSCDRACDAMGSCDRWSNGSLCFSRDRWFGGVDLLLMFRNGDRLPPLVTTGPATDSQTAGQLGASGTRVLSGGESEYKDVTAGGRVTLGTWLDDAHCRSLVFRGWAATEADFDFSRPNSDTPVLARPFFNVTDGTGAQDTIIIAFPEAASGSVNVDGSSNVFGGDISVRQQWYSRFGGSIDVLYGYQYMRLDEDLRVSHESLSLDGSFAPVGAVTAITDVIDTENEFHGGQFGVASRYREGCWSFRSLAKIGFGSLRRTAERSGSTLTAIGDDRNVDPNGLLVRSTNAGTTSDDTFGWIPELDLTLGWHRFPCFDVTMGYHLIAMTDALQVSGALDPDLASNLSSPPTGPARPSAALRYDTFYMQSIHFGLHYIY